MLEKPQNIMIYVECEAKTRALDFRDSCKISVEIQRNTSFYSFWWIGFSITKKFCLWGCSLITAETTLNQLVLYLVPVGSTAWAVLYGFSCLVVFRVSNEEKETCSNRSFSWFCLSMVYVCFNTTFQDRIQFL